MLDHVKQCHLTEFKLSLSFCALTLDEVILLQIRFDTFIVPYSHMPPFNAHNRQRCIIINSTVINNCLHLLMVHILVLFTLL